MMPEGLDITFNRGNFRFRYRIGGVGIHNNRVLLQQMVGTDYWFLPGGRGRTGETSGETLRREMHEELGESINVGRLLWVAENFFSLDDRDYHEVSLLFLMTFQDTSPLLLADETPVFVDDGVKIMNRWHDIAHLESLTLVPSFLQTGLKELPDAVVHITHRDG